MCKALVPSSALGEKKVLQRINEETEVGLYLSIEEENLGGARN
jgi:hypothetical protein